jgi:fumarate hydratase subunit beta
MEKIRKITTPLSSKQLTALKAGDLIELSGTIYTARDQAHKLLIEEIEKGNSLPIPSGAIIYYAGPSPAKQNEVIGSCGPTTSGRMDPFTPTLIEKGFVISIGKGSRNKEVEASIKNNNGLYLAALGGCGALLHSKILSAQCIAYKELLSEAIYKLEVKDFPLVVAIDSKGNNLFEKWS